MERHKARGSYACLLSSSTVITRQGIRETEARGEGRGGREGMKKGIGKQKGGRTGN